MRLPDQIQQAIEAHARWAYPHEACGLIAADADDQLRMAYCLTNIERNPSRFTVDPAEHFGAQSHAERHGWRIAGAFHSHPHSAAEPSAHDVAGALDPTWIYVIAGPVTPGGFESEADVAPTRASRQHTPDRAPTSKTQPGAPAQILTADSIAGRDTSIPVRSYRIRSGAVTEIDTMVAR